MICDDLVIMHLQYSTQWDGLAHVGSMFEADVDGVPEPVHYNGFKAGTDVVGPGSGAGAGIFGFPEIARESTSVAKALGIEKMSERCVQGRAVMIDLHAHVGRERVRVRVRVRVGYDLLMEIMRKDQMVVEPGDIVCLHTGFAQMLLEMNKQPDPHAVEHSCAVLEERDEKLLQWITDSGLVALIADNYAVEGLLSTRKPGSCAALPLHEHCLFKLGGHMGEIWHLKPLAQWLRSAGRSRFLLTTPPLRLPGTIGSPVTPIATV